jgi:hypothetical protein
MGGKARAPTKEARELIRTVERGGCAVERLGSGHFRISRPGRAETVTMSGTAVSGGVWHDTRKKIRVLLGVEV